MHFDVTTFLHLVSFSRILFDCNLQPEPVHCFAPTSQAHLARSSQVGCRHLCVGSPSLSALIKLSHIPCGAACARNTLGTSVVLQSCRPPHATHHQVSPCPDEISPDAVFLREAKTMRTNVQQCDSPYTVTWCDNPPQISPYSFVECPTQRLHGLRLPLLLHCSIFPHFCTCPQAEPVIFQEFVQIILPVARLPRVACSAHQYTFKTQVTAVPDNSKLVFTRHLLWPFAVCSVLPFPHLPKLIWPTLL